MERKTGKGCILMILLSLLLASCGMGTENGSNTTSLPATNDLFFSVGTPVPVLPNMSGTTTYMYLHNSGTTPISGITLSGVFTNDGTSQQNLLAQAPTSCKVVLSGEKCLVAVNIPRLNKDSTMANGLVTATYTNEAGRQITASGGISFKYVPTPQAGLHSLSDVVLNGYGRETGYAVAYLYAGYAASDSVYKVNKFDIDEKVKILHNDLQGKFVVPGSIIAVEFEGKPGNSNSTSQLSISAALSGSTQNDATTYATSENILITPGVPGHYLVSSSVPPIDVNDNRGESAGQGSVIFINAGTMAITNLAAGQAGNVSITPDFSCARLMTGQSCIGRVQVANDKYSGVVTVANEYGSGQLVQTNVNWYNSQSAAPLVIPDFKGTVNLITGLSAEQLIVYTNISGQNLTNIEFNITSRIPGISIGTTNITCDGDGLTLLADKTCTVKFNLTANREVSMQPLEFSLSGTYDNGSQQRIPNYMNISASPGSVSKVIFVDKNGKLTDTIDETEIIGNGMSTDTYSVYLKNIGSNEAILGQLVSSLPDYFKVVTPETDSKDTICRQGKILKPQETCIYGIQFGPVYKNKFASGTVIWSEGYTQEGSSATVTANQDWSINMPGFF